MAKIISFPRKRDEEYRRIDAIREADRAYAEKACKEAGEPRISKTGRRYRYAASKTPAGALVWKEGYATAQPHNPLQLELDLQNCTGRVQRRPARPLAAVRAEIEARGQRALEDERALLKPRYMFTLDFFYVSMGGEVLCTTLRGLTEAEWNHLREETLASHKYVTTTGKILVRQVVWPSESTAPIIRIEHEE